MDQAESNLSEERIYFEHKVKRTKRFTKALYVSKSKNWYKFYNITEQHTIKRIKHNFNIFL